MRIVIITDGNNVLGMGHIYQSLTLAGFLFHETNHQSEILFITKSDQKINDHIEKNGYKVYSFEDDDGIFTFLLQMDPDRIIFDKLDVSPKLAVRIKGNLKGKLIILTNLSEANSVADVTVLADIGSNFQNIYRNSLTGKVEFLGPKYWLLRPQFYEYKKLNKVPSDNIRSIMLIFGGSDPSNITTAVMAKLLEMDEKFEITLVLGLAFKFEDELNEVLSTPEGDRANVRVVKNMKNVAETMFKSDVVFASPGLSFFEALAVGTPVLGFHQDELQRITYKELLPTINKNEISRLPDIIRNRMFIFPSDPVVRKMDIGDGKDEIIKEILN